MGIKAEMNKNNLCQYGAAAVWKAAFGRFWQASGFKIFAAAFLMALSGGVNPVKADPPSSPCAGSHYPFERGRFCCASDDPSDYDSFYDCREILPGRPVSPWEKKCATEGDFYHQIITRGSPGTCNPSGCDQIVQTYLAEYLVIVDKYVCTKRGDELVWRFGCFELTYSLGSCPKTGDEECRTCGGGIVEKAVYTPKNADTAIKGPEQCGEDSKAAKEEINAKLARLNKATQELTQAYAVQEFLEQNFLKRNPHIAVEQEGEACIPEGPIKSSVDAQQEQ